MSAPTPVPTPVLTKTTNNKNQQKQTKTNIKTQKTEKETVKKPNHVLNVQPDNQTKKSQKIQNQKITKKQVNLQEVVEEAYRGQSIWAKEALSASQMRKHASLIMRFKGFQGDRPPTPKDALNFLEDESTKKQWLPSTLKTNCGTLIGAMRRAHLYGWSSMDLIKDPEFRDASKRMEMLSHNMTVRFPKTTTPGIIHQAIKVALRTDIHLGIAIILSWASCARVGCTLQLNKSNLYWNTKIATDAIQITFTRGKTVNRTGPYTIPTRLGRYNALMKSHIENNPLFPELTEHQRRSMGTHVKNTLRQVDPELEQRSLRRTALQTMALSGVDKDVLLQFSRHADNAMLMRYLGWGKYYTKGSQTAYEASAHLCL